MHFPNPGSPNDLDGASGVDWAHWPHFEKCKFKESEYSVLFFYIKDYFGPYLSLYIFIILNAFLQPLLFFNGEKVILGQNVADLASACLGFGPAPSSCCLYNVHPAIFVYVLKFEHLLVCADYTFCH